MSVGHKISPLGVAYHDGPERLRQAATEDCALRALPLRATSAALLFGVKIICYAAIGAFIAQTSPVTVSLRAARAEARAGMEVDSAAETLGPIATAEDANATGTAQYASPHERRRTSARFAQTNDNS